MSTDGSRRLSTDGSRRLSTAAISELRPIGLIVNPRSGNDVRRVVASAGSSTLEDKASIVRRVVLGARVLGATRFITHLEPHGIVRRATETLRGVTVERVGEPIENNERDTTRAVAIMAEMGCAAVVVLGGDGTNRAAAKGWPDMPVIPLSTGTNNAFPYWIEPTVAGSAAGLLATGVIASGPETLRPAKVVRVQMPDGVDELALVDAVAMADPFVGSLELFEPENMRVAVLTRADPAAIGFSAVGGLMVPCSADDDSGVLVRFGPLAGDRIAATRLYAPTAPGHYAPIGIDEARSVALGESITVDGPMVLAFDGERKRLLLEGEAATFTVRRDGPRVVDVTAVMSAAARAGVFVGNSDIVAFSTTS